jgi:uncharacterized membrane protein
MTIYDGLKIIHVISASILFGTGMGTAFYMLYVNFQKDTLLIAKATAAVVVADWCFTATSGVVQMVTGLLMVWLHGYPWMSLWVMGSLVGYVIAGLCWLPVVALQIRCRDLAFAAAAGKTSLPAIYYRYFRIWWVLGIPAFLALVGVYYLMANRPVL